VVAAEGLGDPLLMVTGTGVSSTTKTNQRILLLVVEKKGNVMERVVLIGSMCLVNCSMP